MHDFHLVQVRVMNGYESGTFHSRSNLFKLRSSTFCSAFFLYLSSPFPAPMPPLSVEALSVSHIL